VLSGSFVFPPSQKYTVYQNNEYLDYLNNHKKSQISSPPSYLDTLRTPRRKHIKINLPIIIPNNQNVTFIENYVRKSNIKQKTSMDGTFKIESQFKNITFKDVGGYDNVKLELLQIIDMIRNREKYAQYGLRTPKGILLEGPTGNGKTLLAKAFSGEIDFPIIVTSGSEFNEKFVGVGASRIRELFQFAEENEPCVIFIDEIDALTRKRSSNEDGASGERDQTLNQLLVNLDGFVSTKNIIVIGATNRLDILDRAVTRPGRMDKIIHVPNPDSQTRQQILSIHLKQKPIQANIEEMVSLTAGLNGAQIENLLNEACLTAIRNDHLPVNITLLEETKFKIVMGQSIGKKNLSDTILTRVAIHEIGHLIMAMKSSHFEKPTKVTIDSSVFNSLGYTLFPSNDKDEGIFLREYLLEHLQILLGGRVAEETIYGLSVSSGALSDFETAFGVAKKMIMEYGMGTSIIYPYFSESYKRRIDQEIHLLIKKAHDNTKRILLENKSLLLNLSNELKSEKTLYYKDFVKYFEDSSDSFIDIESH
jgi:cell division protease FtsH